MAKIAVNQFWETLEASGLLSGIDLQSMQAKTTRFADVPEKAASRTARWLTEQNLITKYQAAILLAGHAGPFQFGNYLIQKPTWLKGKNESASAGTSRELPNVFLAVHKSTRFSVLLHFFPGKSQEDLRTWNAIEAFAAELSSVRHPSLVSIYETVVTPDIRFVVTGIPVSVRMSDKLPTKSRLPGKKAASLIAPIADAVKCLHEAGISTGGLTTDRIWIGGESKSQWLVPFDQPQKFAWAHQANELHQIVDSNRPKDLFQFSTDSDSSDDDATTEEETFAAAKAHDVSELGALLFRLVTGRTIEETSEVLSISERKFCGALKRYEMPDGMDMTVFSAVHADEPDSDLTAGSLCRQLCSLADVKLKRSYVASKTEQTFQREIDQWVRQTPTGTVDSAPAINTQTESDLRRNVAATDAQHAEAIRRAVESTELRRNSKWKIPAAIAGAIGACSIALGAWAIFANMKMVPTVPERIATLTVDPDEASADNTSDNGELTNDDNETVDEEKVWLIQDLIPDNQIELWESPTSGQAIYLDYLPNAPQMVAVVNWADFLATGEGNRVLESLGPDFLTSLESVQSRAGFPLSEMQSSTISLHSDERFRYQTYYVVNLKTATSLEQCVANWNEPELTAIADDNIYVQGDLAYWVIPPAPDFPGDSTAASNDGNELVSRFAVGPREWVEQVATSQSTAVGGSLLRLTQNSDRTRHVNLFFLRSALFNDEGKAWMGDWAIRLQPELRLAIPDEVRGGLLSLHIDRGDYLELKLDHQVDIRPDKLALSLQSSLEGRLDSIGQLVNGLSTNSYWDQIRLRYQRMLSDLSNQWRWDVEFGNVVANAWLPPSATANLLSGSELAITFAPSQMQRDGMPTGPVIPENIEALLAAKRSLKITNPPDLNVLLSDIEQEVRDQYLQLPFEFNIRLMGADLQKDGITQNQRPGELNIENQSLADILTSVMASANPNRNITGPADPDCKLVWVLAVDPENESQQAVLVTTRAAAAAKGYQLPEAFVGQ